MFHSSVGYNFNLEIRVGEDGEKLGNNQICAKQLDLTASGAANITCLQPLFGDCVNISKSSIPSSNGDEALILGEVRIFGGEYNKVFTTLHINHFEIDIVDLVLLWFTYRILLN